MKHCLAAWVLSCLLGAFWANTALAHEARPGYLELREQTTPGHYQAVWKQPANGEYVLRMDPVFPQTCKQETTNGKELLPGALISRFDLYCPGGMRGKTVTIRGLEFTLTDVLVRLRRADGTEETRLARADQTSVSFGDGGGGWARAWIYLSLGIRHIVMGLDHLLFVFGLMLIVRSGVELFKTVTAFTVAHSITLAAATFGYVHIAMLPLNAAIALSILFLGPEIMRTRAGGGSFTIARPWVIAFCFGLLHGLGFASGLADMGLPHAEIPLALLLFNVGVEIGQIAFVLLVLALQRAFRLMEVRWPRPLTLLPAYTVGVAGAIWTIQRLFLMFATGVT